MSLEPADKNDLEAVKLFALSLCKSFLGGVWNKIELNDFNIGKPS